MLHGEPDLSVVEIHSHFFQYAACMADGSYRSRFCDVRSRQVILFRGSKVLNSVRTKFVLHKLTPEIIIPAMLR